MLLLPMLLQRFFTNIRPNSKWGPRTKYEAEQIADQEIIVPPYTENDVGMWNTKTDDTGGVENKGFQNAEPNPMYQTHL